jgi:hypothetical protein
VRYFGGGNEHSEYKLFVFRAVGPANLELPADFPIKQASYEPVSAIRLLTVCGSNLQVGCLAGNMGQMYVAQSIEQRPRSLFLL